MRLRFIHSSLNFLLDLILPRRCLGCGAPRAELCAACLSGLAPAPISPIGVQSLYDYQDPLVKAAVWRLKYKGAREIGEHFGRALYEQYGQTLKLPAGRTIIVAPIPLSARRLAERGFNQAAVIAQAFVRTAQFADGETKFRFTDDLLLKIKDTPTQVSIKNRVDRLANLSGAFAVARPADAAGQTIILVDDVATTGGTIAEAKLVLKRAGAGRLLALTIAHG